MLHLQNNNVDSFLSLQSFPPKPGTVLKKNSVCSSRIKTLNISVFVLKVLWQTYERRFSCRTHKNAPPFVHRTANVEALKEIQKSRTQGPCFIYKELITISNEARHADPRVHRFTMLSYNRSLIKTCFFLHVHSRLRILHSAHVQ